VGQFKASKWAVSKYRNQERFALVRDDILSQHVADHRWDMRERYVVTILIAYWKHPGREMLGDFVTRVETEIGAWACHARPDLVIGPFGL
jgi:hypothetical protein